VTTPAEDEAKAAKRRAKIESDIKADEQRLVEQRWPFRGPRAMAKPAAAPAPAFAPVRTSPLHSSNSGLYGSSYASFTHSQNGSSAGSGSDGDASPMLSRPPKPISSGRAAHRETAAALLRAQANKQAMLDGKFDTREEK
jgi:hypothetical protein